MATTLTTVLVLAALGSCSGKVDEPSTWQLHLVEYARSEALPLSTIGVDDEGTVDMSWSFAVATRGDRVVLIDSGSDTFASTPDGKLAKKWHIGRARTVVEALAAAGHEPSDVTDVVLSHRHWDHVGGVKRFANATVHAQAGEWAATGMKRKAERLKLFDGHAELIDGISATVVGGHTPGHAVIEVQCAEGPVVLAGDAAYLARQIAGAKVLEPWAQAPRVLPGHDPGVFGEGAEAGEHVVAICPAVSLR